MDVILNDQVEIPSITSREYVPSKNGVAVSTFVPSNEFTFSAGSFITISGGVEMKLADSVQNGRKLLDTSTAKKFDEKSSYEMKIDLAPQEIISEEEVPTNSASFSKSMGLVSLGMIFVFSYTMS